MEIKLPVLVGVQFPGVDDAAHAASFEELGRLMKTLGYAVTRTLSQHENARVLSEAFDADGRVLHVRGLPGGIARLCKILSAP